MKTVKIRKQRRLLQVFTENEQPEEDDYQQFQEWSRQKDHQRLQRQVEGNPVWEWSS